MALRRLQTEFQSSYVLFPLIPLLVLGIIIVIFYYHSLKSNILSASHKTTDILAYMLADKIKQSEDRLSTLATVLGHSQVSSTLAADIIHHHTKASSHLRELRITDRSGRIQVISPANPALLGTDMSGEPFIKQAFTTGFPSWSRAHLSLEDDVPVSPLAIPFNGGILVAYYDFRSLSAILDTFASSHDGVITVLDQSGTYLYHPDQAKVIQRQWEMSAGPLREALNSKREQKSALLDTGDQLITGSLISSTGWMIAVFQDKSAITAPILRLSIILFWGCLLFTGIGFLISLRTSSHYFSYFKRLAAKIHDVADGVYNQDSSSEGYHELHAIESDFNRMTEQIMNREGKITSLNLELKKQLDEAQNAILQRKAAEKELQKTHETFVTVLDSIESTIIVTDLNSHEILFANRYTKQLYNDDSLIGKYCWSILKGNEDICDFCRKRELLDEYGLPTDGYDVQEKNEVTGRWVMSHNRAIRWTNNAWVHIQISTDITRLKEVEEKLRQSQKMEAIGTLAGGVAHDFNNILAAIFGYAELAKDQVGAQQKELQRDLDEILKGAERARELVKQILAFSRQSGREQHPLRLQEIINDALKLLRPSIPTTIDIRCNMEEDCPEILANPTELHQVIMNICTNGYQAMRKGGGLLSIELTGVQLDQDDRIGIPPLPPGAYACLSISDSGHGIDKGVIDKIFDPYFTSKPQGEGTGLGLAVVHGIVTKYRGAITVESAIDVGTTFRVFLPVSQVETTKTEAAHPTLTPLPTGHETVLVVDDDEAVGTLTARTLTNLGYTVTTLTSSVAALLTFSTSPDAFELVITDMTMPEMTGAELAEKILAIRPDIPVILSTGFSDLINEESAKRIGIGAFLMKPSSMETLSTTVRRVLDGRRFM